MKTILLLISILFTTLNCLGQGNFYETNNDSVRIESEIKLAYQSLKDSLEESSKGYEEDFLKALHYEFALDTLRIEKRLKLKREIYTSSKTLMYSNIYARQKYELLLNKYYQRLLKKFEESDRQILVHTQKNWLEFRDSEITLNNLLAQEPYVDNGLIQNLFRSARPLDLTRNRVIEIYHYLRRIEE